MIPKIIHYIWVGGPLPDAEKCFVDTWRTTNPDYEFVLWDDDNIDFSPPMLQEAYRDRKWSKVADIVRLMVVAKYGGIYFDIDFRLFASLQPVMHHQCFLGFQQKKRSSEWIGNGVIGAEPDHRFVKKAIDRLFNLKRPLFGIDQPTNYGPRLITRLLREEGLKHYSPAGVQVGDVFVLPTQIFYPYDWLEKLTDDKITSETIGAHIWSEVPSWAGDVHPILRLAKKSRRSIRTLVYGPLSLLS
jgi:mannosyltransferase OCH1-like enzyme